MYLPYVNYYVNYTYISTTLCENKDKPQMHCNGKCHLKKTIAKAEADETKSKSTSITVKLVTFQEIPSKVFKFEFNQISSLQKNKNTLISQVYSSPILDILSPPPQTA